MKKWCSHGAVLVLSMLMKANSKSSLTNCQSGLTLLRYVTLHLMNDSVRVAVILKVTQLLYKDKHINTFFIIWFSLCLMQGDQTHTEAKTCPKIKDSPSLNWNCSKVLIHSAEDLLLLFRLKCTQYAIRQHNLQTIAQHTVPWDDCTEWDKNALKSVEHLVRLSTARCREQVQMQNDGNNTT